jgi:hypothetical protein
MQNPPPYQQPYYQPPKPGMSTGTKIVLSGCAIIIGLGVIFIGACAVMLNKAQRVMENQNSSTLSNSNSSTPLISTGASKWKAEDSTSEMDSSKGYIASLEAENMIKGWLKVDTPTLIARCKEGEIDIYIRTGMAANVEYGGGHTVRLRFDDGSPIKQKWSEATNNEALFSSSPKDLAQRIAKAKTFKFEFVPFNGSTQVAQFNVQGFQEHLDKLLATCKKR